MVVVVTAEFALKQYFRNQFTLVFFQSLTPLVVYKARTEIRSGP